MTVLIPNARIASRWHGALQARLRHAPLEKFLRSRGRKWAASGDARNTDNLACATIFFIAGALEGRGDGDLGLLTASQREALGQSACAVSSSLASLIQEPEHWRTAALVATARLLERQVGLSAAAHVAAAAAREYNSTVTNGSQHPEVLRIGEAVRNAVDRNSEADTALAVGLISVRLYSAAAPDPIPASEEAVQSYDVSGATIRST